MTKPKSTTNKKSTKNTKVIAGKKKFSLSPRQWALVVAAVVAVLSVGAYLAVQLLQGWEVDAATKPKKVTVATYNILDAITDDKKIYPAYKDYKPWADRASGVLSEIKKGSPSIVGLQEAGGTKGQDDTVKKALATAGYNSCYPSASPKTGSAQPIYYRSSAFKGNQCAYSKTFSDDKRPLGVTYAQLSTGNMTIHVFNTHLATKTKTDKQRKTQMESTIAFIRGKIKKGDGIIVMGDMNDKDQKGTRTDQLKKAFGLKRVSPAGGIDHILVSSSLNPSALSPGGKKSAKTSDHGIVRASLTIK